MFTDTYHSTLSDAAKEHVQNTVQAAYAQSEQDYQHSERAFRCLMALCVGPSVVLILDGFVLHLGFTKWVLSLFGAA